MDRMFPPELGLDFAHEATYLSGNDRLAVVLPTTLTVDERIRNTYPSVEIIGRAGQAGVQPATAALQRISRGRWSRVVVIHTDQLHQPADATILALLQGGNVFLSPIECILNDKYRFSLSIWTSEGMEFVPAQAPLKHVVELIARHLKDCYLLGDDWTEMRDQVRRTPEYRRLSCRRQLRYITSSIANAFRETPEEAVDSVLFARVIALGQSVNPKVAS